MRPGNPVMAAAARSFDLSDPVDDDQDNGYGNEYPLESCYDNAESPPHNILQAESCVRAASGCSGSSGLMSSHTSGLSPAAWCASTRSRITHHRSAMPMNSHLPVA